VETGCLIALKFGTQKGGVRADLGTKFGSSTIKTRKVIHENNTNMLLHPQDKPHMARS